MLFGIIGIIGVVIFIGMLANPDPQPTKEQMEQIDKEIQEGKRQLEPETLEVNLTKTAGIVITKILGG